MVEEHKDAGHHGFILGILVGILIALLFTTQKGRKLFKVLSTEGSKKFSNLDDLIAILEREIGEDATIGQESVVGEDPSTSLRTSPEEVKEIDPPKKVLRQAQDEKQIEEEEEAEVESTPEPEKLEKIDTEHLEQEIQEEKKVLRQAQDKIEEKIEKIEKIETELVKEKEAVEEKPKKKSRRLFKGIRRKSS